MRGIARYKNRVPRSQMKLFITQLKKMFPFKNNKNLVYVWMNVKRWSSLCIACIFKIPSVSFVDTLMSTGFMPPILVFSLNLLSLAFTTNPFLRFFAFGLVFCPIAKTGMLNADVKINFLLSIVLFVLVRHKCQSMGKRFGGKKSSFFKHLQNHLQCSIHAPDCLNILV